MRKHPSQLGPEERAAARHRPAGWATIKLSDGHSVVYYGNNSNGRPAAVAYRGRAIKPAWRFYFSTAAQRAERVQAFIADVETQARAAADRRGNRAAHRHALQIGDVLVASWGYDQTNIDYYEVTRRSDSCVWVREIGAQRKETASMVGDCVPVPGSFKGPEKRRLVVPTNTTGNATDCIRIASYAWAYPVKSHVVGGVKIFEPSHWTAYA